MASRDDLDPLGTDWEQRAKRGIAVMREKAYEEASGSSIPIEPLTRILADLSGRVSGVLGSIPERIRDFGGTQEMSTLLWKSFATAKSKYLSLWTRLPTKRWEM